VLGFLAFHLTINYLLGLQGITAATTTVKALMETKGLSLIEASIENARYEVVLGFFTYRMNVFAGIIVGLVVSALHNKFYRIKLPDVINFFGGKRFVPIIVLVLIPFVAGISYAIWPAFDYVIAMLGLVIASTGVFGTFIFGLLNRLLIPTGLHHILNQLVRFTPIGGTAVIDGETVNGALNIYSGALAAKVAVPIETFQLATRYIGQGHMLTAVFALPGAAYAMIKTAPKEKQKMVATLLIAGVAASMVTGITEPLEFSFMFVSPILFVFHAVMTGLGYMVMAMLNVSVGNIQGGLIDFIIFGVFRGLATNWFWIPVVGSGVFYIYYKVFCFVILRFNVNTPGRGEDENLEEDSLITSLARTVLIVDGLGGLANIIEIENCFTRLRVELVDGKLVDEQILKKTNPAGILKQGDNFYHVIYGLQVEEIARDVKSYIKNKKNGN
ncbi:MAG: PTS transporter subunit EIIC, partial [Culicoidibacterales bacterium]